MPGIPGAAEERKLDISTPLPSKDIAESPWSGTLGAGRGRGVRPPNTAPKGWAGPASAPDASTAPLPPTAWHHDRPQGLAGSNTSQQPYMNIAGMLSEAWPYLSPSPNLQSASLHNDFESFSLFDKDSYDY